MYDFVCKFINPGCHHTDSDEDKAELYERAIAHLREHDDMGHDRDALGNTLDKTGAVFIRPA